MIPISGETYSILAAVCWTINSLFFSYAGRRIGAQTVNLGRLGVGLVWMVLWVICATDSAFSTPFRPHQISWLVVSGVIGFSVGDACLFEAYVYIGPRLTMLLSTLTPLFSAVLGFLFLKQRMNVGSLFAMAMTMAAVVWVISGREGRSPSDHHTRHWIRGCWYGVGAAVFQSVGSLCSVIGLETSSPVTGNVWRIAGGFVATFLIASFRSEIPTMMRRMRDIRSLTCLVIGGFLGPVLGVVFSLYGMQRTSLGVAATLCAISPILLLPVSHFFLGDRVTVRSVTGTLLAVAGIAGIYWFRG